MSNAGVGKLLCYLAACVGSVYGLYIKNIDIDVYFLLSHTIVHMVGSIIIGGIYLITRDVKYLWGSYCFTISQFVVLIVLFVYSTN